MKIHFTDGDKVKYFSHIGDFFDGNNTEYQSNECSFING